MLKTYELSRPTYFAIAAEARRLGIPFGGHVMWPDIIGHYPTAGLIASDSGARFLDHELYANVCGEFSDTLLSVPQCAAAAARLRRNHTWVTLFLGPAGLPVASLPDSFLQRALRYTIHALNPLDMASWQLPTPAERRYLATGAEWAAAWAHALGDSVELAATRECQVARLAYVTQLPWLPGPDFPLIGIPGVSVHLALLNPVLCGLPPLWALQAATLEPARALGLTDSLGTVAVGKVADLVLLEGDPLEDIWYVSKPWAVLANGRYFDRAALDQLLREAPSEWATVCRLWAGACSVHRPH